MNRCELIVLLLASGLLTIGLAGRLEVRAQASLVIDAGGTCPRHEDLVRINPALDEGSVGGLVNRIATPSRSGLRVYRTQTLSDPPVQSFTLTFDDEVEVLIGAALGQPGGGAALVRRMREPLCGWINVADLERFTQPMLLRELPGFEREPDRFGQASRLEARVVVKNRFDRQTGYARRAPLFHEPFTGEVEPPEDQRRGSIGYFEVLSVFAVKRPNGQDCRSLRDSDCFLRVGSTTVAGTGGAGMVRTRGWMRASDVEIWPSALATYYGRGKQGLKIHSTEPSARIGTPYSVPGATERILAYQPEGRFEEPRQRNIMRFPVIRGTFFADRAAQPRPGATTPPPAAGYAYEIVFNGQACVENTSGETTDCIPEPQIKDEVARLGQAVRAISNIDVLFVMDATESMGPYLRSVVRALRKHVERATANREWSFRYSVAVYGDYNRMREGGLDYYALPFTSDLSGLDPLQKAGTYEDENKDKPEAPFAALERAASEAQWRPEAANRLIIWIGDHGNRPAGRYTTPAGELVETKTAQSVIDAIKSADARLRGNTSATGGATKTRFVAIQVQGGATAASQQDFKKFRDDADAIGRGLGETQFKNIPAGANRNPDQEVAALVDSIASQIDSSVSAVTRAREIVRGALGGDAAGIQPNLPSALLAREFLAQLGFPPERLREMGRRIQVVQNGFIYQSGRNPDFRYWLGLRQPEFVDVAFKAKQLCENLRFADRVGVVENSILSLVRAVTFTEMRPGESVRAFFTRIFSVPADAISPMLGEGTPADFVRAWSGWQPSQKEQLIAHVCKKARILQYVSDGQIVDERDLVYERNTVALRQGATPKDFDWRWITADARTVWFFVPLDVLP
jgi:hypothetical protein